MRSFFKTLIVTYTLATSAQACMQFECSGAETKDGGIVVAGNGNSNIISIGALASIYTFNNAQDFYLFKLRGDGTL